MPDLSAKDSKKQAEDIIGRWGGMIYFQEVLARKKGQAQANDAQNGKALTFFDYESNNGLVNQKELMA